VPDFVRQKLSKGRFGDANADMLRVNQLTTAEVMSIPLHLVDAIPLEFGGLQRLPTRAMAM
jgi:hypothetical protein